jgi:hypothetical protein
LGESGRVGASRAFMLPDLFGWEAWETGNQGLTGQIAKWGHGWGFGACTAVGSKLFLAFGGSEWRVLLGMRLCGKRGQNRSTDKDWGTGSSRGTGSVAPQPDSDDIHRSSHALVSDSGQWGGTAPHQS